MFGMKVMESNHLQFLSMEEKDYMKQQHMGCYKTLQAWNLKLLLSDT
jgi:hypothetical protein